MKPPYRLGRYELKRQIGKGATAIVYHAYDTFSNREVAVKVIRTDILADPEFGDEHRKQFLNEASLAGRLSHPHIVAILEASVSDDSGYVVMEYVPEGNLSRHTAPENLLPIGDILQIIFKCCGALDYAFRQGVIHRDLKPSNIMISSGTDIRIADFGASVLYQAQVTQKLTIGTPYYMSPEQIRGRRLTHHSDMYSLGILAYELLTGVLPFQDTNLQRLFTAISTGIPSAPGKYRPEIPARLDEMILRMIEKNPDDRYPGWEALALDIAEIGRFSKFQQEISDSEKFLMLRGCDALQNLTEPEIWDLIRASTWSRLPGGTALIREGEAGHSMFFLASGEAKVTKNGRLLNVLKAGEFFGEMAYIRRGTERQSTLTAISDVVVAEFPFPALEALGTGCELQLMKILLLSATERLMLAGDRIVRMHG